MSSAGRLESPRVAAVEVHDPILVDGARYMAAAVGAHVPPRVFAGGAIIQDYGIAVSALDCRPHFFDCAHQERIEVRRKRDARERGRLGGQLSLFLAPLGKAAVEHSGILVAVELKRPEDAGSPKDIAPAVDHNFGIIADAMAANQRGEFVRRKHHAAYFMIGISEARGRNVDGIADVAGGVVVGRTNVNDAQALFARLASNQSVSTKSCGLA